MSDAQQEYEENCIRAGMVPERQEPQIDLDLSSDEPNVCGCINGHKCFHNWS